jgi:hypothetical protein
MCTQRIKVRDVINTNLAIFDEDGIPLFKELSTKVKISDKVIVDFNGVTKTSTAFFNYAIGNLYINHTPKEHHRLDNTIEYINLSDLQKNRLMCAIDNAKNYQLSSSEIEQAKSFA